MSSDAFVVSPSYVGSSARGRSVPDDTLRECSMETCFDFFRCRKHGFKVYVYPSQEGVKMSPLFEEVLNILRNSHYATSNPDEACLFVPSLDTLDRDKLSSDFVKNLPPLSSLPYWNGGRNHLLFVQFAGTWPHYSEHFAFLPGQALLARASSNINVFRSGFDVSVPLVHKEYPKVSEKHSSIPARPGFLPLRRKYLLVFKGKRYLYGQGSRLRSSLYHLHNHEDIVMLTTCKHNQDWEKYTDSRCNIDNDLYGRYSYEDLMKNSSFCLIPRGRRLGSFRFLEALQASCIPISLSNGYILPFSEVLDWKNAVLVVDERQMFQLPYLLRGISSSKILSLRWHAQFMWDTYFSSLRKIVSTTLEIIRSRIDPQPIYMWNRPPGHLQKNSKFSTYPFDYPLSHPATLHGTFASNFTAFVTLTRPALRDSSPAMRLLQTLAKSPRLSGVVMLWAGVGMPQVMTTSQQFRVPITTVNLHGLWTRSLWPLPHINTSAVLLLNEGAVINSDEIEFGFTVWQSFPSRLVGFVAHTHSWDKIRLQWAYSSHPHNHISMVTSEAIFYHKLVLYMLI